MALKDSKQGEDNVADNKSDYGRLDWSDKVLFHWNASKKKADGYFVEHQSLKSRDPFSLGVIHKFSVLPLCEFGLVSSKTVMHFHNDETGADGYTECCE